MCAASFSSKPSPPTETTSACAAIACAKTSARATAPPRNNDLRVKDGMSGSFAGLGIEIEQTGPAVGRIDGGADDLRVGRCDAMLKLDARGVAIRDEANVHFALDVLVELKLAVQMPGENQALRRLPGQYLTPIAFATVDADFVPAPARPRLDHHALHFGGGDVMRLGPPAAEARGEHLEGALARHLHADGVWAPRGRGVLLS